MNVTSQEEPKDKQVQNAIIDAVANLNEPIKPNKLRKLTCKLVKGTNWTQYQRVLDRMILQEKTLVTCLVNKEQFISPLNNHSCVDHSRLMKEEVKSRIDDDNSLSIRLPNEDSITSNDHCTISMKIPLAIVYHLVKKGQKKQKSIEQNTKTKFKFHKESIFAVKKKNFDLNEVATLTIQSLKQIADGKEGKCSKDEKTKNKHLKTVNILITKMVQSYKKNPHHFYPKKSGGTFKEQEEAKKRKMEARGKYNKHDKEGTGKRNTESVTKKRRRKFY